MSISLQRKKKREKPNKEIIIETKINSGWVRLQWKQPTPLPSIELLE